MIQTIIGFPNKGKPLGILYARCASEQVRFYLIGNQGGLYAKLHMHTLKLNETKAKKTGSRSEGGTPLFCSMRKIYKRLEMYQKIDSLPNIKHDFNVLSKGPSSGISRGIKYGWISKTKT